MRALLIPSGPSSAAPVMGILDGLCRPRFPMTEIGRARQARIAQIGPEANLALELNALSALVDVPRPYYGLKTEGVV